MMDNSGNIEAIITKIKNNNSKKMTPFETIKYLNDDERFKKQRYEELCKIVFNKLREELTLSDSLESKDDIDKVKKHILNKLVNIDDWEKDGLPKRHFSEHFDKTSLNNVVFIEYRKKGLHNLFDELYYFTSNGGYYTINLSTGSISIDDLIGKAKKDEDLKSIFDFIRSISIDDLIGKAKKDEDLKSIFDSKNGNIDLSEVSKKWYCKHENGCDEYIFIDRKYQTDRAQNFISRYEEVLHENDNNCHLTFEICSKELLKNKINAFRSYLNNKYSGNVKNLFDPDKEIDNRLFAIKLCFVLEMNFEEANLFLNRACGVRAINNRRNLFDNIFEYCLTRRKPYATFEKLLNDFESSNYTANIPEAKYIPGGSGITTILLEQQASSFFLSLSKTPNEFLYEYLLPNRQKFIDNSHKIKRIYDELRAKTAINYIVGILEKFEKSENITFKGDAKYDIIEINKIFNALTSNEFLCGIKDLGNNFECIFPKYKKLSDIIEELKEKLIASFSQDYFSDKSEDSKDWAKSEYKKERVSIQEIGLFREYNLVQDSTIINSIKAKVHLLIACLKDIEIFSEIKSEKINTALQSLEKLRFISYEEPNKCKEASGDLLESIKELINALDNKKAELHEKCKEYINTNDEKLYIYLQKELKLLRSLYFEKLLNVTRSIGHLISTDRIVSSVVPIEYSERTKENNYKASPKVNIRESSLYTSTLKNLPQTEYLNKFENGDVNTFSENIRRTIILMFFFGYIMNWNAETVNKSFDDFYNRLYNLLESCKLSSMDVEWDRFDWLILKTILLYNNAKTEEDYRNASSFIQNVIKLSFSKKDEEEQYLINSDKHLILLSTEDNNGKIIIIYGDNTYLNKENLDFEYVKDFRFLKSNEIAIWILDNATLIRLYEKLKSEENVFNVQNMLSNIGRIYQENYCDLVENTEDKQSGNINTLYRHKICINEALIDAIKYSEFLSNPNKYVYDLGNKLGSEEKTDFVFENFEEYYESIATETILEIIESCK